MAGQVSDSRIDKRRHLFYYSKVIDRDTGKEIGRVADISLAGIMLIRADEIEPGELFRLRVLLPAEMDEGKYIDFEARSRWSKRDINPDYHVTGFEIENIDTENEKLIIALIKACAFDD